VVTGLPDATASFAASMGWVRSDTAEMGDLYDPGTGKFSKPVAPAVPVTLEQVRIAVQERLDAWARTRNYDGILSACTYATSSVAKFRAEGQAAVDARDATWARCYEILTEVDAGTRPAPTDMADVLDDLPTLTWPEAAA
jgi:hypothetical protein